ncbi:flagellin [Neptuniibacter sp. QD48_55]|uniref:flagellin N-terminal helical domain-containing protein n=1 Tax=Neptuniibacter sp. QD48_55 TaxID=3398212 RepID=UPI0039F5BA6B
MAMVINSNIMSLNAQRNLMISQGDQNQAMERLTSGKRINSAGDDAAGLAIANRLTSQVRGLDQAVRNANDGISLIQTAEGALDETTNILQRMRELSIQSANGTYTDGDRSTLNAEVQQLVSELDRIADTTSFNGQKILDGSQKGVGLQVGAEANETIAFTITDMSANGLGSNTGGDLVGEAMDLPTNIEISSSSLVKINGQFVDAVSSGSTLKQLVDTINDSISTVEASTVTVMDKQSATAAADGILGAGESITITAILDDGQTQTFNITDTGSKEELVDRINEVAGTVVTASLNDDGDMELSSTNTRSLQLTDAQGATGLTATTETARLVLDSTADDNELTFEITTTDGAASGAAMDYDAWGFDKRGEAGQVTGIGGDAANGTITAGELFINGVEISTATTATNADANVAAINKHSAETGVYASLTTAGTPEMILTSIDGSEISIEGTKAGGAAAIGLQESNEDIVGIGDTVADIDISTAAGAQEAIDILDAALEDVNSVRSDLGAVNNRLDFTINNLSNVSENAAAARSRIEDADFAAESAALSRAQVLQQAGTAMLAQANAAPQQVLSLLQ